MCLWCACSLLPVCACGGPRLTQGSPQSLPIVLIEVGVSELSPELPGTDSSCTACFSQWALPVALSDDYFEQKNYLDY